MLRVEIQTLTKVASARRNTRDLRLVLRCEGGREVKPAVARVVRVELAVGDSVKELFPVELRLVLHFDRSMLSCVKIVPHLTRLHADC